VVLLLLLAVIVGAVLLSEGDDSKGSPPNSEPSTVAVSEAATAAIVADAPQGPVAITGVRSFDPGDPEGGVENDDTASLADDGDSSTAWKTSCYNNRYFNGKPGVGLVVSLSQPATGTLTVVVDSAPYQLRIFASDAESAPTDVAGWGSSVQSKSAGQTAATIAVPINTPARHLLVLLLEAGSDDGCKQEYPYRGQIGELTFSTT